MGNTSFILLRGARRDGLDGPGPQFAELTGAYWLEPIYAGLANEWSHKGREVPGTQGAHLRILAEGPGGPDGPEGPEDPEDTERADEPAGTKPPGDPVP